MKRVITSTIMAAIFLSVIAMFALVPSAVQAETIKVGAILSETGPTACQSSEEWIAFITSNQRAGDKGLTTPEKRLSRYTLCLCHRAERATNNLNGSEVGCSSRF